MLGLTKQQIMNEANKLIEQNVPFAAAIAEILDKNNQLLTEQITAIRNQKGKGDPPWDLM